MLKQTFLFIDSGGEINVDKAPVMEINQYTNERRACTITPGTFRDI